MDDNESQRDELFALDSIYLSEELTLNRDSELLGGTFYAFQRLSPDFLVVSRNEEDNKTVEIPVSHLPPIALTFTLPTNYPSESMPQYTLACYWLSPYKLKRLCNRLDDLWEENKGSVILYTWMEFLKLETLEFLKIDNHLEMNVRTRKKCQFGDRSSTRRDPRVISSPVTARQMEQFLRAFNDERCETIFLRSTYECGICFECKKGSESVKFKPCGHIYCARCICDFFKVRIKDGSVREMPCPYDKCPSQATQKQVKEVVGTLLYVKYDDLLLAATLNAMDDITYCPRSTCNSPVMTDDGEKLAMCSVCKYVFCTFCRMTYHGVAPCRLRTEEKKKLIEEYEQGDEATRKRLEKQYGKKQFLSFVEEAQSEAWMEENSKPCPKCRANIEKLDGCNKMECKSCKTYFCWLCASVLNNQAPYDHYWDPKSPCRNQLFLGMDFPDDEDDLDGFVIDVVEFLDDDEDAERLIE